MKPRAQLVHCFSRGKVPLYHFIKTPVEPPRRMTAAVEASSIRAPDDPDTIHCSTAPVPRYLQLPSTTFLLHGRLLPPPAAAYTNASGPRGPAQALGQAKPCLAVPVVYPSAQDKIQQQQQQPELFVSTHRVGCLLISRAT